MKSFHNETKSARIKRAALTVAGICLVMMSLFACRRKEITDAAPIRERDTQLVLDTVNQPADTSDKAMSHRRTPVVTAIQTISPAVVNISTETVVRESLNPFGGDFDEYFRDFHNMFPQRDVKRQTLGSGVIIDSRGYILTNEHVVMSATKIKVILPDHREYEAKVIGSDSRFDLAVIQVAVNGKLPAARMGDSDDIMIGETVIAIGNPFGLEHTVTTGVVSALHRTIQAEENKMYSDFIQTDASINPGNSGGPLVNLAGEVVGINTAIYAKAEGIGFAIPINRAKRAVADLLRFGEIKPASLGLRTQELTPELSKQFDFDGAYGALVAEVIPGGPADKAGVDPGDIIVEINSAVVRTAADFADRASAFMVDDKVLLAAYRGKKRMTFSMTAASLQTQDADKIGWRVLGVNIESIGRAAIARYGLTTDKGVVVNRVRPGGPLARIGVQAGDIIRRIGDIEIQRVDDYNKAVIVSSERSAAFIVVQRRDSLYYTTIRY